MHGAYMTLGTTPTQSERIEMEMREAHSLPNVGGTLIGRVVEISNEIPKNVNDLDAPFARYIAGLMLEGMALCGELYSLAVSYELKTDAKKRAAFSQAMMIRAAQSGLKTSKDREQFAFSDSEYLEAQNKCTESRFFKTMIEEKKQLFLKAHHLMKDVVSRDTDIVEGKALQTERDEWGQRLPIKQNT